MEEQCKNFPLTINIEGDIKRVEIIRENCEKPKPPEPEPPGPLPP